MKISVRLNVDRYIAHHRIISFVTGEEERPDLVKYIEKLRSQKVKEIEKQLNKKQETPDLNWEKKLESLMELKLEVYPQEAQRHLESMQQTFSQTYSGRIEVITSSDLPFIDAALAEFKENLCNNPEAAFFGPCCIARMELFEEVPFLPTDFGIRMPPLGTAPCKFTEIEANIQSGTFFNPVTTSINNFFYSGQLISSPRGPTIQIRIVTPLFYPLVDMLGEIIPRAINVLGEIVPNEKARLEKLEL